MFYSRYFEGSDYEVCRLLGWSAMQFGGKGGLSANYMSLQPTRLQSSSLNMCSQEPAKVLILKQTISILITPSSLSHLPSHPWISSLRPPVKIIYTFHVHPMRPIIRVHIALQHYWATLFLGDINTGTWPMRLGESQMGQ
jgi:hypothetical protein